MMMMTMMMMMMTMMTTRTMTMRAVSCQLRHIKGLLIIVAVAVAVATHHGGGELSCRAAANACTNESYVGRMCHVLIGRVMIG